ncbi:MAG TPA: hypothetical protein VFF69_08090 [Phycisphaerales bacterium]|nr:hypothetical protein [Phycisphaerales bacterium]
MGWNVTCGLRAGTPEGQRAVRRLVGAALGLSALAAGATIAVALLLKGQPEWPAWLKGAVALSPVIPFAGMFAALARVNRHMDELAVRVQFEALATTVIVSILLLIAWGQLQQAELLPLVEVSVAWPAMVAIYAVGYWRALRRYC